MTAVLIYMQPSKILRSRIDLITNQIGSVSFLLRDVFIDVAFWSRQIEYESNSCLYRLSTFISPPGK